MIVQYKNNNNWTYEEVDKVSFCDINVSEIANMYKKNYGHIYKNYYYDKLECEIMNKIFNKFDIDSSINIKFDSIFIKDKLVDQITSFYDYENMGVLKLIYMSKNNKNLIYVTKDKVYLLNNEGKTIAKN